MILSTPPAILAGTLADELRNAAIHADGRHDMHLHARIRADEKTTGVTGG